MIDCSEVELVSISASVLEGIDSMEDLIVYMARVSNPENQMNFMTGDKLIRYLVNKHHWSPFQMCNMVVSIRTPRDISRQILRHRSFTFQEFSQRYAKSTLSEVYRECRMQDEKNRQNSISLTDVEGIDHSEVGSLWDELTKTVKDSTFKAYQTALDAGIAKEVARTLLPEGFNMSHLYMNGTIRDWIHYVQVRTEAGTQKEHRLIAHKVYKLLCQQIPVLANVVDNKSPEEYLELNMKGVI